MLKIKLFLASLLLSLASHLLPSNLVITNQNSLGSFQPNQAQRFSLSGSGITSSASSIGLTSFKYPDGTLISNSTLNSSITYGTLEPGTTKEEQVSFTGVTQNSDGTATLTGVSRGLSFYYPFAASTTLQTSHAGAAVFVLSNTAGFYSQFGILANANSWTGINTFASTAPPTYDGALTFTNSLQLIDKSYADSLAFQGVATATESTIGASRLTDNSLLGTGTASSTSGAPLVLKNANACNSFNAASSTCILVTDNTNHIASNFIATSSQYTFASTTITKFLSTNATSTTLGVTGGSLNLNGVAYNFPTEIQASSSVARVSSTGKVSWSPGADWEQLGQTILGSSNATVTVSSLPASYELKIDFFSGGDSIGAAIPGITFNGDNAANYGYFSIATSSATFSLSQSNSGSSANAIILSPLSSSNRSFFGTFEVSATNTAQKVLVGNDTVGISSGAGTPAFLQVSGVWNNTTSNITSVSVSSFGGALFNTGATLTVFGRRINY